MSVPKIMFDPAKLKLVDPKTLKKDPKNRNKHSPEQIERLCKLFQKFGMRWPILVSERTGVIKAGEGRLLAALKLKMPQVLVSYQDFDSDETEWAFGISDNAIQAWSDLDIQGIVEDIGALEEDFEDLDLLGIESFDGVKFETSDDVPDPDNFEEEEDEEKEEKKEVEGSTKIIIHLTEEQHAKLMPRIQKCCEEAELYDLTSLFTAAIDSLEKQLGIIDT
jgi:hypothetical protein